MLSSEVLPAPFGPMIDRMLPLGMSTDTPSTAVTPPKALQTPSTDICTAAAAVIRLAVSAMFMRPPRNGPRRPTAVQTRNGDGADRLPLLYPPECHFAE